MLGFPDLLDQGRKDEMLSVYWRAGVRSGRSQAQGEDAGRGEDGSCQNGKKHGVPSLCTCMVLGVLPFAFVCCFIRF